MKAIMIQGTMSNVGKSLLTAALCRIFRQDGFSTAPFKSQNMALNSFITPDGCEIGRAQALQAEAAGIEPSALMNPILLKPTTDVGSQVIVNGQVRANMRAAEYFKYKPQLIPEILSAFHALSEQYDIVVIEGAGSPVELNLKKDDIVNMGLAQMLKVPVLLAGDIDRGGIFAQLLGTLDLLEPSERHLVRGLIVNQFRGDAALFRDGIDILSKKSGLPVLGVIPHINHHLEDEDSLSQKLNQSLKTGIIDIAVIHLPKISNFTDFDVFTQYSGVSVRYVNSPELLGNPDLLIIPGSKSTIADMRWMQDSGMADAVRALAARGFPIFGICGGYQILGTEIADPENTECGGTIAGLGLLPCKTCFSSRKYQSQVTGKIRQLSGFFSCISGAEYEGYEVHMGETESDAPTLTETGGSILGQIAGCYVHGFFDRAEISGAVVKALYQAKGLQEPSSAADRRKARETELDLLADTVRAHLDLSKIYQIMEQGI